MTSLDAEAVKQLLTRNWMTHDAMWFLHAMQATGMEQTNRINKAAVRAMAMFEAKRILRAFDLPRPTIIDELEAFFQAAMGVVVGDFAEYDWRWDRTEDTLHAEFIRCFAHEGMKRLETFAEGEFDTLYAKHKRDIAKLKEQRQQHFQRLRLATSVPQTIPWALPETIDFRRSPKAPEYLREVIAAVKMFII